MNIDKIITDDKYKKYLERIQGSLSGHDLTLTDIRNYRRCGRSHKKMVTLNLILYFVLTLVKILKYLKCNYIVCVVTE